MVKIEPGFRATTDIRRRNFTSLTTFNEARKPQYVGRCKLSLDLLSQALFVKPKHENFNDITATFNWKFIRSKNILFVFADFDFQDFVLVFKNEEICTTVFNGIFKNREFDFVEEDLLKERFLNPLFKNAFKNWRMKEILGEWIQKFDEKEKNEYLKILNWHQENPEFDVEEENDIKDVKMEVDSVLKKNRKRRHCEIKIETYDSNVDVNQSTFDNGGNEDEERSSATPDNFFSKRFTNVIKKSKFKIVNLKIGKRFRRKLLIFTLSDKTQCYEFTFHRSKQIFYHRCRESVTRIKAILGVDENGIECIKMEDKKHQCSPIFYETEKYSKLKIVKKPDYEILENCATKSKSRRMLIIFVSNDKSQCHEYFWYLKQKAFYCRGCASKGRGYIFAEIFHESTVAEYVVLSEKEHICEKRKYKPEKYFSSNQIVLSPNFEIQTKIRDGSEREMLIIFDENDRKFCQIYYSYNKKTQFSCSGCFLKNKKIVSAKIYKNDENEEYVILSNAKHVCSPRNYVPQNKIIILRPPKFKLIEATEKFKSKLFIFDSADQTLCYVFSQDGSAKRYHCLGCILVAQQKNKTNNNECRKTKQVVTVTLNKYDGPNGEHFVKIFDGEKHICQPQKYEPEKYEMKILKPKSDYILFRDMVRYVECIYLVIYHPDDKKLCYKYIYNKANNIFQCSACLKIKTIVSAKLHQDSAGNEYLTLNEKEHICSPIKYSSVIKHDTVILEKSGLKTKEVDENRIVRCPDFELQRNRYGVPERRLVIFVDDERSVYYDYVYNQCKDYFSCKKCYITAKIRIDEENGNEKYVVLSEVKHKCQPVNYKPETEIVELNEPENGTSNFMIFNRDDESKTTKLVTFTSSTKELCYEYSYCNHFKCFQCLSCMRLKKVMSVKLLNNPDDGKEYVQFLKNNHVCVPRKFILEEFQPKIILESGFKLCSNKNGKPNSRLILFDSEKDGFVFEYSLEKNDVFICLQCKNKNISVWAKLFEKENGEKFLELSSTKHVCESKKYEVSKSFVVHFNDFGVPDSRLTVLNDDDKSLGYRYSLRSHNLYFCLGCKSKKKYSSAKLITDKDGNQTLELNKTEHFCTIRNLKKENLYFTDFKFEDNGNALITTDPFQKNRFYKFAYDEKLGTFCCSKCLEKKKKYTTATICKENDGKEFVLLNVLHCCTSVLK